MDAEHTNSKSIVSRREFLARAGGGIGSLALASLIAESTSANPQSAFSNPESENPLAPKQPHYTPKAKRVISLFMFGGISHMESFDYKPELVKKDGVSVAGRKEFDTMGRSAPGKLMKPAWDFKPYGQCGMMVSDLLPQIGAHADDIALIRS